MRFSFEFFPAKTTSTLSQLIQVGGVLDKLNPQYCSVTFGAGGRTQNKTLETITALQKLKTPIAAHISCINTNRQIIQQQLNHYLSIGIKTLVVLRGDIPENTPHLGDFSYAYQLIEFIRQNFDDKFTIFVAAYPEKHPESPSFKEDVMHLVNKINAGADGVITQYFYNIEAFFHLQNALITANVAIPLTPGIMPITNYTQLLRFSQMAEADIPQWLANQLADYQDNLPQLQSFGLEVVGRLCEQLKQAGVNDFHFYTMNKSEPTQTLVAQIQR